MSSEPEVDNSEFITQHILGLFLF